MDPEAGLAEEYGWRRQRTVWYYIGVRGTHRDQCNRASRTNCQQDSQPSPKLAGCPEKELTPRSKCRAPSAGSGCSDSICECTSGTCTRGDDTGDTHACTAQPTRPKRISPSWIGRNTCRTPMSTAWRAMIRSGGRNTLRDSNWTDGDGSIRWRGTRPTGPTSVSGLYGSIMAGTKARER